MLSSPRAPTPSNVLPAGSDVWTSEGDLPSAAISPSSAYIVDSPISTLPSSALPSHSQNSLGRSASEEDSIISDSSYSHSARSPQIPSLPDPSQFPDPYPFRPPHWQHGTATPALSSADSSTASTRSSAYTNSAKSGDYGHVHVALGDDEPSVGVGITTDDVVQLLARDVGSSTSQGRALSEQSRWSDSYANSARSRSSSVGNGLSDSMHENGFRGLRGTPSFDLGWQTVDERDEVGLASEEETDDYVSMDEDDQVDEEEEEEPTSAMVIAEEGRGIIVRGEDVPIVRLQVKTGTTHLLIGSSSTPNAVPSFLTNTLPHITGTLLALDISANFLVAIPPALGACVNLEELNIASNPLRILPIFLASLTSLRVLIVDSTGITTLPDSLSTLDKLHTLSIRRNKLSSLPSWLCLLPALETLLVDGNPFQGPWKALMEPLLASSPMTPLYPPSTPIFPPSSASVQSSLTDTDVEDDLPWHDHDRQQHAAQEEEDTITPARAPHLARAVTSPTTSAPVDSASPRLSRTRTTPNRAHYDKTRSATKSAVITGSSGSSSRPASSKGEQESEEREVRRMKSAGELRRNYSSLSQATSKSAASSPQRPTLSNYVTASGSDLFNPGSPRESQVLPPKRFASLGAGALSPGGNRPRLNTDSSFWDSTPAEDDEDDGALPPMPRRATLPRGHPDAPPMEPSSRPVTPSMYPTKEEKEKHSRWGFLKKMSMGKMRPDQPPPARASPLPGGRHPPLARNSSSKAPGQTLGMPQIDVRISTTGTLLRGQGHTYPAMPPPESLPTVAEPSPEVPEKPSVDALKIATNTLLAPTSTSRAMKRRSFLPIDMPPMTIPAPSSFVPGLTATSEPDDPDDLPPDPLPKETLEEIHLREEERAREARTRALRSVMAYLKDMHDLGLSQMHTAPTGAAVEVLGSGLRSRRPTVVENGRLASENSVMSIASASTRPDSSVPLRSVDSMLALRSGSTTQTNSVATTDSGGSGNGEERKYKDDKVKRSRIIREIVETERTYVKGLQELVDIYISPAATPVNVLTGVSQRQETVVPAPERKIVFGGLEALFIFHKESFLPALESASAPLLGPLGGPSPADADGYLSLDTANKVAQTFVSHAAFMKMYSTYINNFDNSVQRIRTWALDKPSTPSSGQTLSPSSSNAQLVGLSLAMSGISAPSAMPENGSMNSNVATLSSSQRKRIKSYLKRCRLNPRHSQLNLEGYLLLPVQRIPRYRMLLEELVRSSPPMYDYADDLLDRALAEISSLATNMNEGKRDSESRRKLVLWQSKIRGKFPSPLVQPHRRLIMDGALRLTRVVRKATVAFEIIDSHGDSSEVQVECLSPELTPRSLIGILCNDLLVLCRDPSNGQEPNAAVDLWAVLRMQTLPQPASIVHGNALRLVDNKAILYFDAPSTSDALTWFRAINLHIPASKA
ncbi:hypothetical protein B0H21DRAFT_742600 [Amylocystis lapponica]|nr:hypothetical protein B0H21DRAFT_742600 [Amylocystis lapponica]